MQVSSTPAVEGSWYWVNDQKAHWRPRNTSRGHQVSVDAGIYGANLGAGLYGQRDSRVNFTIGPSHVTVVDDVTKQVNVYVDGELVRTMPTSMGRGGTETVGGKTIAFWTQPGVYTVMEKQNPVLMDSSTYGLPVDSASGYKISVPHAVRISPDGIYLHEREATVWAQGNTNVSAGCLNLSADNAEWFYDFAQPGDVVEIRNTGALHSSSGRTGTGVCRGKRGRPEALYGLRRKVPVAIYECDRSPAGSAAAPALRAPAEARPMARHPMDAVDHAEQTSPHRLRAHLSDEYRRVVGRQGRVRSAALAHGGHHRTR